MSYRPRCYQSLLCGKATATKPARTIRNPPRSAASLMGLDVSVCVRALPPTSYIRITRTPALTSNCIAWPGLHFVPQVLRSLHKLVLETCCGVDCKAGTCSCPGGVALNCQCCSPAFDMIRYAKRPVKRMIILRLFLLHRAALPLTALNRNDLKLLNWA